MFLLLFLIQMTIILNIYTWIGWDVGAVVGAAVRREPVVSAHLDRYNYRNTFHRGKVQIFDIVFAYFLYRGGNRLY
jgi:hypothetical protein